MVALKNEELESVSGGVTTDKSEQTGYAVKEAECEKCGHKTTFHVYSGGRGICQSCSHQQMM